MEREYQMCKRCVMDTTDPDIVFDENGVCNHCKTAEQRLQAITFDSEEERKNKLNQIVGKIKEKGKGKKYDCVIGLSGGVDSSYLAHKVKELGLRPLAVHLDNGWDSELAVKNIESLVRKLRIDLYTHVINWEEFRDLQLAFLKAGVIDLEMLSDNAIVVSISNIMKKYGVKYFLIGTNTATESIMPGKWVYTPKFDSLNIRSIYSKYGNGREINTYPLLPNLYTYIKFKYNFVKKAIPLLNYIDYDKYDALKILEKEYGWRDYGGKHHESIITHFYQIYILPRKYNVDKRKAHLSSLIMYDTISREEALDELSKPICDKTLEQEEKAYFLKKLNLADEVFEEIMNDPPRDHRYFPSYEGKLQHIKNMAVKLGVGKIIPTIKSYITNLT